MPSNVNETEYASAVKTSYERRLLTRALPRLIHTRFGDQARVNRGFGTLEFRKYAGLSAVTTALDEGNTPNSQLAPSLSSITITPLWYGAWLGFTDKIDMVAFDPLVSEMSAILGEQAGLSIDTLTRNTLVAGATDDFSNGVAARANLAAGDKIAYADFLVQIAELEAGNARPVDGRYKVIIHPYTWATLMQDTTFVTLFAREANSAIRSGLVGTLLNCDIYVSSNAASYTLAGSGSAYTVYSALFIGAESYGVYGMGDLTPNFNMDGSGAEYKNMTGMKVKPVNIIIKDLGSAGTADPLNQRGTLAWKCAHIAKILNSAWIRDLEHINDMS